MVVEYIGYTVPSDRAKQFERAGGTARACLGRDGDQTKNPADVSASGASPTPSTPEPRRARLASQYPWIFAYRSRWYAWFPNAASAARARFR